MRKTITITITTLTFTLFFFFLALGQQDLSVPHDAVSLLTFKSKADLDNNLLYTLHEPFDYCEWQGVKCHQSRVVRLSLPSFSLRGSLAGVERLDQLRALVLRNNSLAGPIPNLSSLLNLKTLILDGNRFSGEFPPSILSLYKLRIVDLSFNNFSGTIPVEINKLDRLSYLKLEFNRFNGVLPALNMTELLIFNVSGNNLTGEVPVTPTISRFGPSSFVLNPNLCGEIVNKPCNSNSPFFDSSARNPPTKSPPMMNSTSSQSSHLSNHHKNRKSSLIFGFTFGSLIITASFLCFFLITRNQRKRENHNHKSTLQQATFSPVTATGGSTPAATATGCSGSGTGIGAGELVFSPGEESSYTMEKLMKASAEMLGRGTLGTTYKAKMEKRLIVTVKRVDGGGGGGGINGEMFMRHMERVGALRHPNVVAVRAYFQAKGERLVVYDYLPNGSVFNLVHGSRSTRARPLHWTSCLKIAEDVAQGLAYIHQASKLPHGNLKSTNVLLGPDFEACVTDYCLSPLSPSLFDLDADSARYRAPEARKSSLQATPKSDVFAFGVLLLELLSGKTPSQHPFLAPLDMPDWVRAMRGDDDDEGDQLGMLVDLAGACSLASPEQRPTMWQVLKMIQTIKNSVVSSGMITHTPPTLGFS